MARGLSLSTAWCRRLASSWVGRVLRGLTRVRHVGVQHVRQNIFSVLETLDHFQVGGLHGAIERVRASFALFVYVGDDLGLRAEHDLGVVLEVHLHNLVGKSEHDCVARPHPLLDVDDVFHFLLDALAGRLSVLLEQGLGLVVALKVRPEVLQQGDLLEELLGVLSHRVLLGHVLSVALATLHV